MCRTRGVGSAAVMLAAVVALAGCATSTSPASADAIAERASGLAIAPELVYTTEVDGYDLAPQSVGVSGSEGLSATWVDNGTGAMVMIRTDRGELTAASCAATPMWDTPDAAVTCAEEDGVWHRSGGGIHEYAVVRDGALIRVIGMNGAPPADLLVAARAVHVPSNAELEWLFSDAPEGPGEPVERGDIPENGDGAPINPVGPGG